MFSFWLHAIWYQLLWYLYYSLIKIMALNSIQTTFGCCFNPAILFFSWLAVHANKSLRISGIYQISFNKNMTQIIFNLLYEGSLCSQNSNKRKDIFETDLKVEFDKFTHSLVSNLWLRKMVIDFLPICWNANAKDNLLCLDYSKK